MSRLFDPFDVVFIMDESGSMDDDQAALITAVPALFAALQGQAPGSRAGLVGYGNDGVIPRLRQALTTNHGDCFLCYCRKRYANRLIGEVTNRLVCRNKRGGNLAFVFAC